MEQQASRPLLDHHFGVERLPAGERNGGLRKGSVTVAAVAAVAGGGGGGGAPLLLDNVVAELNGIKDGLPQQQLQAKTESGPMMRRSSLVKDLDSRRPRVKKTVSFTSMPNERKITSVQDCIAYMMRGSKLVKLRSNSRQYWRTFTLDGDKSAIRWTPTAKKPEQAKVPINAMKEVLIGKRTDVFRAKEASDYAEDCAFSIVYGVHYETLDLLAKDVDEANIWVTGLMSLMTITNGNDHLVDERETWLVECFEERARAVRPDEHKACLSQDEVSCLIYDMSSTFPLQRIKQRIKEFQRTKTDEGLLVDVDCFLELYKDITTRPEIYHLLIRHANKEYMTVDDLITFLEVEQGMMNVSREHAVALIEQFEPSSSSRTNCHLHIEGLTRFLLSESCFDPEQRLVCQDMTQPLAHYFIASSHNTYLVEDQLKGPSSIEGYIQALINGCRFLEMDVWDGSDDDPVIFHGHTLTSKVPFRRAVEAIRIHAFEKSHYPLILCIEVHCSVKQQLIMVDLLKTSLGPMLLLSGARDGIIDEATGLHHLPSPEALKNKILILGRKLPQPSPPSQPPPPPPPVILTITPEDDTAGGGDVTEDDESAESISARNNERPGSIKRIRLARPFSDLINYCQFQRFKSFTHSAKQGNCCCVESIPECVALKLAHSTPEEFVQHTRRFLTRVYPSGIRVDSSNFSPQDVWNCGVQIAAMNYQSVGLMMDMNTARFSQNGNCGYVLKPTVMREDVPLYNIHKKEIPGVTPHTVHIKIISAINLPKPTGAATKGDVIDPFAKLEVYGIPSDCCEFRTKTVLNNGVNPVFDETFEFRLAFPDLALIRFVLLDDECIGDDFIAQYCIPMDCMQTGYRHVRLKSLYGKDIPNCYLFIHIAVTNKNGGGKSMRTGISGLLLRHQRQMESLKPAGVKVIDDLLKNITPAFKEAAELKDNVARAILIFKEECGQNQAANVKQCVRSLLNKFPAVASSGGEVSPLKIQIHGAYPEIGLTSLTVSEHPRKVLTAFDNVIAQCRYVIDNADRVTAALAGAHKTLLELYEEMQAPPTSPGGPRLKKTAKISEHVYWNIRLLKGHGDLAEQTLLECQDFVKKGEDSVAPVGVRHTRDEDSVAAVGRNFFTLEAREFFSSVSITAHPRLNFITLIPFFLWGEFVEDVFREEGGNFTRDLLPPPADEGRV
ncbi:Inactive phospholipase C-like protein 2 [Hypsibius exemplaris]|uniref:Phosphoinositide phospholipase C n=1 Tax=Hypsibius exemplaris TaxID=2072580 RepID=A0A1W0WY40_HYPEX|nr:Inactive phospholipase C-like protein 2 [Hypsibius exemplaris]